MTRRSRSIVGALTGLVALPLFFACGDTETPRWVIGDTPDVVRPEGGFTTQTPRIGKRTPIQTEVESIGTSAVQVTCEIPAAPDFPQLFAAPTQLAITGDDKQVCFDAQVGCDHCMFVSADDVRDRAISNCHKTALQELDTLGKDAIANLGTNEGWAEAKRRFVPALWAITPKEAVADVGYHAGWIAVLMGSDGQEMAPDPFCFNKKRDQTLREAKNGTLFAMWWLWQQRQAKQNAILSALKRGVHVLVNPELPAIQVTVQLKEVPQQKIYNNPRQCVFAMPPTNP